MVGGKSERKEKIRRIEKKDERGKKFFNHRCSVQGMEKWWMKVDVIFPCLVKIKYKMKEAKLLVFITIPFSTKCIS